MEEQNNNIWWLNEESEQMLNRGYLLKGETVDGAIDRITTAAAKRLYKPELQPAFKEMITKGWISFSSPVWANMGNREVFLFLVSTFIFRTALKELLTKWVKSSCRPKSEAELQDISGTS
jgi:hypothetical protein